MAALALLMPVVALVDGSLWPLGVAALLCCVILLANVRFYRFLRGVRGLGFTLPVP